MNNVDRQAPPDKPQDMQFQVEKKTARRLSAQQQKRRSVWFGLGMFGLVGWAVAVPTVLGIVMGMWLDRHWAMGKISWTLTLLFVGVILGCLNAWRWIARERHIDHPPGEMSGYENTTTADADNKGIKK